MTRPFDMTGREGSILNGMVIRDKSHKVSSGGVVDEVSSQRPKHRASRNVLLAVDIQRETRREPYYSDIINWINNSYDSFDYIIATCFVNVDDSEYIKYLGYTGCKDSGRHSIEYIHDLLLYKTSYSVSSSSLVDFYNDNITLVGCDLESCVLATAYTLWDNRFNFNIDINHCYSSNVNISESDIESYKSLYKQNFGSLVV